MSVSLAQTDRPLKASTVLGDDALVLLTLEGEEAVSMPFQFTLELLSHDPNVAADTMLRSPVTVSIELPGGEERVINGLVSRFIQWGTDDDGITSYRVDIVPWLWFLSLSSDCKVFQNLSVLDIVKQVFQACGYQDFDVRCVGTYAPREYCVQYRETHLNFVSRLLEEEGIFYFFEHTDSKHTLVLADSPSAIKPCVGAAKARLERSGAVIDDPVVTSFIKEQRADTGKVTLADYNYLQPSAHLLATVSGPQREEWYDYPGDFTTATEGDRYARIRLEEREAAYQVVSGESTCVGFESGYRFELTGAPRRDLNTSYQLLRVKHEATNGGYSSGQDAYSYKNAFVAIPAAVPYRPPCVTRKPVVPGSQTAVVVGQSGEEIWTEKFGRVKIQFFWDRVGKRNDASSCWVRVSSAWAGKGWGQISTPRLGQEVIVDFLEGDPDRPIVTGRVYNAEQMPPYPLPNDKTQSGVRSNSSKGGGGFNEILLEDKQGAELISVHAQKDLIVTALNNESRNVSSNRSTSVGANDSETIGSNQTIKIGQDQSATVGGKRTVSVSSDDSSTVGGSQMLKVGGSRTTEVGGSDTESIAGSQSISVAGSQSISVGESLTIGASLAITLSVGGSTLTIGPAGVMIEAPMITLTGSGVVAITGSVVTVTPPLV